MNEMTRTLVWQIVIAAVCMVVVALAGRQAVAALLDHRQHQSDAGQKGPVAN
jgi:hypothetical protein